MKKKVVVALGHRALGTTLPEQKVAVKKTAVSIADLVEEGYQVVITHSNGPQVGMIHTAMNELYRFSDVSLLCYVAGLHRIRPAECDSRRTDRTRHLSQRMHRYHTGNC